MQNLTKEEKNTFMLSLFLLIFLIFPAFIIRNTTLGFFFLFIDMSIIAICLVYIFIIKPIDLQDNKNLFQVFSSFRFRDTKPRKIEKKSKLFGVCAFCGKQVQFGFTCSYCGNYFCPEHRLPEKHFCPELR
ncbi:MAG: AN1-type zinc finger domain-containing protein [Candidatus Hodarchaeales archaeon]